MKKVLPILLVFLLVATHVEAARIPSTKAAQSLAKGFFKRYGKKYPTSLLGKDAITRVDINEVAEVARNLAYIDAFLAHKNGNVVRVLVAVRKKPPVGWKVESWEISDIR